MPETPPNAKLSIPTKQRLTPISGVWRFLARGTVNLLAFVRETAILNSNSTNTFALNTVPHYEYSETPCSFHAMRIGSAAGTPAAVARGVSCRWKKTKYTVPPSPQAALG